MLNLCGLRSGLPGFSMAAARCLICRAAVSTVLLIHPGMAA